MNLYYTIDIINEHSIDYLLLGTETKNIQLHAFDYILIKKSSNMLLDFFMMIICNFNFLQPWLILSIRRRDF